MDSILNSTKLALGILPEYTAFDDTIILHINSVFSILQQMGVGPDDGFSISDATTEWNAYISDSAQLNMVQTYMNKKVGLMFDPPLSSAVMESQKNIISELEWRLNVAVDPKPKEE